MQYNKRTQTATIQNEHFTPDLTVIIFGINVKNFVAASVLLAFINEFSEMKIEKNQFASVFID